MHFTPGWPFVVFFFFVPYFIVSGVIVISVLFIARRLEKRGNRNGYLLRLIFLFSLILLAILIYFYDSATIYILNRLLSGTI